MIRTQKPRENRQVNALNCAEPRNIISSSTVEPTVTLTNTLKPSDDAWGADSESWDVPAGDDWGAEAGEWEGEDEVTAAVIDALLEEREMGSVEKLVDQAKRTATPDTAAAPAVDKKSMGQDRYHMLDSGRNRLMHRCFPAKPMEFSPEPWGSNGSGNDKDMEKRIQRYRDKEEDRGLIAELDRALGRETGDGSRSQVSSGRAQPADGEKYERTPKR